MGIYFRTALYVLCRLPDLWHTGLVFERARVVFLRDVAGGMLPERSFLRAMRAAGIEPGTMNFAASLKKYQGFAHDAGITWEEGAL